MKYIIKFIKQCLLLILCLVIVVFTINGYVKGTTKKQIYDLSTQIQFDHPDCILILGAGLKGDGPSPMLEDRLKVGIDAYKKGYAPKIIMSGDHGQDNYDEVNIMKKYAIEQGVPSEDIFMDHAGFSTYDSMYRAKEIFGVKKMIVVTQEYHLYRALYIAKQLDMDVIGISSNLRYYSNQTFRDRREFLARIKDFIKCIFQPESQYLGEPISLSGSGDVTNDK